MAQYALAVLKHMSEIFISFCCLPLLGHSWNTLDTLRGIVQLVKFELDSKLP